MSSIQSGTGTGTAVVLVDADGDPRRYASRPEREVRASLAEHCDLDRVAKNCSSFARFLKDLAL